MKGPYERLKYDLRRLWECPVCQHRERTPGEQTFSICRCQTELPPGDQKYMRLVEDGVRKCQPKIIRGERATPSATPAD